LKDAEYSYDRDDGRASISTSTAPASEKVSFFEECVERRRRLIGSGYGAAIMFPVFVNPLRKKRGDAASVRVFACEIIEFASIHP